MAAPGVGGAPGSANLGPRMLQKEGEDDDEEEEEDEEEAGRRRGGGRGYYVSSAAKPKIRNCGLVSLAIDQPGVCSDGE